MHVCAHVYMYGYTHVCMHVPEDEVVAINRKCGGKERARGAPTIHWYNVCIYICPDVGVGMSADMWIHTWVDMHVYI